MAAPWTPEWQADWNKLPSTSRTALECMFDGPIPHQAVLDELAAVKSNACTINPQGSWRGECRVMNAEYIAARLFEAESILADLSTPVSLRQLAWRVLKRWRPTHVHQ